MPEKLVTALIITLTLTATAASTGIKQGAGISQDVTANIDRADNKTAKQKTQLYCARNKLKFCDQMNEITGKDIAQVYCIQNKINFCKNNVTTVDMIVLQLGLTEAYSDLLGLLGKNKTKEDVDVIS